MVDRGFYPHLKRLSNGKVEGYKVGYLTSLEGAEFTDLILERSDDPTYEHRRYLNTKERKIIDHLLNRLPNVEKEEGLEPIEFDSHAYIALSRITAVPEAPVAEIFDTLNETALTSTTSKSALTSAIALLKHFSCSMQTDVLETVQQLEKRLSSNVQKEALQDNVKTFKERCGQT